MERLLCLSAFCWVMLPGSAAQGAEALPVVSVVATDDYAAELSHPGITNLGLFTFTRTGDVSHFLTVSFTLAGTATPLVDYKDLSDSIVFPPGLPLVTLSVEAIYSRDVEPTESVMLALLPGATYEIGAASNGTVNIWQNGYDDPAPPTVVVWSDGSGAEHVYPGGFVNTVVFTVIRSGPTNQALTVEYTLGGTAVPGLDYTGGLSGQVTIPPGSVGVYVQARPVKDGLAEGNETIIFTLTPTARYVIGSWAARAEGNIFDDDPGPWPTINRGWLAMSDGRLTFRINGAPGQLFHIQSSTNLVDWSLAITNPIPAGGDFLEPASAVPCDRRYFRAVPQ